MPKPSRAVGLELYNDKEMQQYIADKYGWQFVSQCLSLALIKPTLSDIVPDKRIYNRRNLTHKRNRYNLH